MIGVPADVRDNMNNFGEWLRAERERRGWSQAQIAEQAETSIPTISRVETGERNPSRKLATKIATALGADPREALEALMSDTPGLEPLEIERTPDPDREMWVGAYDNVPEHRRKILLELAEQLRQDEKDTSIG